MAFAAHGQLNRISRSGGSALSICSVNSLDGGAWSSDGTILFAEGTGPIYQVPASGGVPKAVTALASNETRHTNPQPLPDGNHFLFGCFQPGNLGAVTCIQGLRVNERSRFDGQGIADALYVEPGYLLFIDGSSFTRSASTRERSSHPAGEANWPLT